MAVKSTIQLIPRDNVVKQETTSPKHLPRSSQASPRTPVSAVGRRVPVPSAVVKRDEGAYCLCRSVWQNGMVACANEDCKVEWYHLGCINLWQKPSGRWVCPKYVTHTSLSLPLLSHSLHFHLGLIEYNG
jgi:hypothetical protein